MSSIKGLDMQEYEKSMARRNTIRTTKDITVQKKRIVLAAGLVASAKLLEAKSKNVSFIQFGDEEPEVFWNGMIERG